MNLQQAAAILAVAAFAIFVLWGRTQSGERILARVFGRRGRRPDARRSGRSGSPPRRRGRQTRGTPPSGRRRAARPAARERTGTARRR